MNPAALPPGLLVGFYADDYTGASAVMEVLEFAGLPTVLFLAAPTTADLARFPGRRAVGIAGTARAQSTEWMAEHLPPAFRALAALGAPLAHYKICSTLDSAPAVGSIGCAIDLAVPILGGEWHPLLVAAPPLGRWQVFGTLFARAGEAVHRLDRHPTMAHHPVTPMGEADVRRHLARQTARPIGLVDILALGEGRAGAALARVRAEGAEIVALDALDPASLAEAGGLIWRHRGERLLAIGSQGVEYALIAHWRASGALAVAERPERAAPVALVAAVSASCSPHTAAQIDAAGAAGFALLPLDATAAADAALWEAEIERGAGAALTALAAGRSPLAYTARGPDDPAIARTRAAAEAAGVPLAVVQARIGTGLGRLLARVMGEGGLARGVVAGGDSSGQAAEALGVRALTALAPLAPGAPLCLAHGAQGAGPRELVFKGGQMGAADFFETVRRGGETLAYSRRTGT